jgi:5-methylcytosine-specific restriction endonuclease McrA
MAQLRAAAYHRSQGICECGTYECQAQPQRLRRVNWFDGQLHHIVSRARGGSDELDNVLFVTRDCHRRLTGELKFGWYKGRTA